MSMDAGGCTSVGKLGARERGGACRPLGSQGQSPLAGTGECPGMPVPALKRLGGRLLRLPLGQAEPACQREGLAPREVTCFSFQWLPWLVKAGEEEL